MTPRHYQKPFFFIEYGSTTCKGAKYKPHNGAPVKEELERTAIERGIPLDALKVPNGNYDALPDEVRQLYIDVVDQEAQAEYYRATFEACERYPFVQGFGVWAWICKIKATPENIKYDSGYGLHLKKLTEVLREYFGKKGYTPIDDLSEPTAEDKFPQKAKEVLDERFAGDNIISLATVNGGRPAVRVVNAYYENGAFYTITHAFSNKMRQIRQLPSVAIYCDWFSANGVGENLGYIGKEENAAMLKKMRAAFAAWYDNGHVNEADENMILLKIRLTDGVLFDHGTRYDITF